MTVDRNDLTSLGGAPLQIDHGMALGIFDAQRGVIAGVSPPQLLATLFKSSLTFHWSKDPDQDGRSIAEAWLELTNWRAKDPRSSMRIIVEHSKTAHRLRQIGFDAVTAFVATNQPSSSEVGLLLIIDPTNMTHQILHDLLEVPSHTRVIVVATPETLPTVR